MVKLSALNADETWKLLNALVVFQSTLDDDDDDLPPELISSLEKLRAKLDVVQHTSFSKADPFILAAACIRPGPIFLLDNKRGEVEDLGKADSQGHFLSFDATVELIKLVRRHVSTATEAGCRVLINVILLRLVSVMQSETSELKILPEFPISNTTFQTTSGMRSFGGVVDFLLASIPPRYSDFLLANPVAAVTNPSLRWPLTPTIIEAKKDNLPAALPQAALAAASYCKQNNLAVLRGCITSGEQWAFFIYKDSGKDGGASGPSPAGGTFSLSTEINLGTDLGNLALVLGLLRDLTENTIIYEQKYFVFE